jgi:hypothetical protein
MRARGPRGAYGTVCRPDLNSSPSLARGENDPDRWGPPISERMGKGRGSRLCERFGLRRERLSRAEGRRKEGAGLGCAGGKRKGERPGWAGPQGGKERGKRKEGWAGPN